MLRITGAMPLFVALLLVGPSLLVPNTTRVEAQATSDLRDTLGAWREAYDAKDWDRAIGLSKRLVEMQPESPVHPYNYACVLALSGKNEEAVEWLLVSVDRGFNDPKLFAEDPDLASVRSFDGYKKALDSVRERVAKAESEFDERLKASPVRVVLPPNYGELEKAPVIVALHPFGGTPEWIVRQWRDVAAERGAILLAPQAVFPQRNGFQWGNVEHAEKVFLRAFKLLEDLKADRDHVILTGFSQGAYMAFNLGMKHCEKFDGVIPVAGSYDPRWARPAGSSAKPRFVILAGSEDRATESNRVAEEHYKAAGIDVHLEVYEGLGHAFPRDRNRELLKAVGRIWPKSRR
ncbi:MAG: dienelactone hydrolase family protein [Planctomycetota bacterium]